MNEPKTVALLGVPFHDVGIDEVVDEIDRIVGEREPRYLVTANLDFATQASGDVELQRILLDAHLVLCDGTPLLWASRWLGAPLRERVAGADLAPKLIERAAARGHRIFFLGSDDEVLREAKARLEERHPGLQICGAYAPPYARLLELDHDEIAARIRTAQPDILLVALGAPKQEKWIYMHHRELGVPCSIGIGASLDFIAGKFSRAPVWMQKRGLEWLFRLGQEPRRLFKRYFDDFVFFALAVRRERKLMQRKAIAQAPVVKADISVPGATSYRWTGRADAAAIDAGMLEKPLPAGSGANVLLDLSGVTFIDSTAIGLVLKSFRKCKEAGGNLALLSAPKPVRELLGAMKLDRLLPLAINLEDASRILQPDQQSKLLRAEFQESEKCLVLRFDGELNAAAASEAKQFLDQEWTGCPLARLLQVNLSGVTFLDSSGLGCLLRARKLVHARDGARLRLTGVNDNVRNVITLARLDGLLEINKSK
jgi:N-acetylglucosaminyldiphosphoundecaprenol N-acetyl-beta-D-mannosaminyltransferase